MIKKDSRLILQNGTVLPFEGMKCIIEKLVGVGSNAIVYQGTYQDHQFSDLRHIVLIKELFPYDPKGQIYRDPETLQIHVEHDAKSDMELHRESFCRANAVHLQMAAVYPSEIDGNINTFSYNGTLYSVLGFSGGRSFEEEARNIENSSSSTYLRKCANRMLRMLEALQCFHDQEFLHLDISPDNVLLIGNGNRERVSIIDYNSVHRVCEMKSKENFYFSQKEGFTAPEILTGHQEKIGFSSDLFSAAAVFYWMLTGKSRSRLDLAQGRVRAIPELEQAEDMQETVRSQVYKILRKGIALSEKSRYSSVSHMKADFEELLDRIDGKGITHAAIWEAGRSMVQKLVDRNPAYAFVRENAKRYQVSLKRQNEIPISLDAFQKELCGSTGESYFLYGGAGSGKTTTLLTAAFLQKKRYLQDEPALFYLSLYSLDTASILDQLLFRLKFKAHTQGMDMARHELKTFLSTPLYSKYGNRPKLILMLDGYNEFHGDTTALVQELSMLSELHGVRVVMTGRTASEQIRWPGIEIMPLDKDEVIRVLKENGIVRPLKDTMFGLLQTPLLLSGYVQALKENQKGALIETSDQLMQQYLFSIANVEEEKNKEYWTTQIAMYYVLPEIAKSLKKLGKSLSDEEVLAVVEKCFKRVRSRYFVRVFPRWIGHTKDMLQGSESAEEWYGIIVQKILWKKLGMLLKDEENSYRIFHQSIEEYMVSFQKSYGKRFEWHDRRCYILAASLAALFLAFSIPTVVSLLPGQLVPYDENAAENVLDSAFSAYTKISNQNYRLKEVLEDYQEQNFLDADMKKELEKCLSEITTKGQIKPEQAGILLDTMLETGEVMPWSKEQFDSDDYQELIQLQEENTSHFQTLLEGMIRIAEDPVILEKHNKTMEDCYADVLEYLIINQKIMDCFYQRLINKELTEMDITVKDRYHQAMKVIPEDINDENMRNYQKELTEKWREMAYVWK